MSHLVDLEGKPLNPAKVLDLVDEETLDALYDMFKPDAPMGWSIEHEGPNKERLCITGWVRDDTEEGDEFYAQFEASIVVDIPPEYYNALEDIRSPRMTTEDHPEVNLAIVGGSYE